MGLVRRVILGRWFTRWLLRGGPWAIAAKLGGVALWGVWRWRRDQRRLAQATRAREISAEYEVLPPDRLTGAAGGPHRDPEPGPSSRGTPDLGDG